MSDRDHIRRTIADLEKRKHELQGKACDLQETIDALEEILKEEAPESGP